MARNANSQLNIWSAALIAVGCRARRPKGRSYEVRWQFAPDHVRFAARDEVVVEPLGVRLSAGDILEVRWAPNDTAYSYAIRRPEGIQ
jgi:hypothetical protein